MQPVGFVSGQNLLVRDETGDRLSPPLHSVSHAGNVLGIGFLEKTALVPRFPLRVVVLDGEKAVLKEGAELLRDRHWSVHSGGSRNVPGVRVRFGSGRFHMPYNLQGLRGRRPR